MKVYATLALSALILGLSSCAVKKTMIEADPVKTGNPMMEMYKSPCFGKCPQFTLTIQDDLTALYVGKSHTDKIGLYKRDITKEQYKELKTAFDKADFPSRPDEYETYVADAQSVTLTFHLKTGPKSVKGVFDRPAELVELERMMDKIANTGDWMKVTSMPEESFPETMESNKMRVQLKPEVDMTEWVKSYKAYAMEIDPTMVPNFNYLQVKYDDAKIKPQEMLVKVRNDERVQTVSFVRKSTLGGAKQ